MHKVILASMILFLLLSGIIMVGHSEIVVEIEMETDKQIYDVGEPVRIDGNVTADGTPVTDALAAIEIDSPNGNPYVIRTVQTGEILSEYWNVQIMNLYTCDLNGVHKTLFSKGNLVYVFISIRNNDTLMTHHIETALYVQYSDNTPLVAFYPFEMDIEAGQEVNYTASIPISSNAVSGEALVFGSIFSDLPANDGTAYCPEKTTSFYIASTTPSAQPQPQYFNITFKFPRNNVKLGNYTIYSTTFYQNSLDVDIKTVSVVLLGDLVKDGKIDMRDIGAICNLYGSKEGDPDWNPEADLNSDKIVNMRDIGIICNSFGKTAIY